MILTRKKIVVLHGTATHANCWMCDLRDTALAYHDAQAEVERLTEAASAYREGMAGENRDLRAEVERLRDEVVDLVTTHPVPRAERAEAAIARVRALPIRDHHTDDGLYWGECVDHDDLLAAFGGEA